MTVLPGAEIALYPQVPDLLEDGKIQSLADTSYLLIEPPFQRLPLGWEQVFFELKSKGNTPLLAHAERCAQLADKTDFVCHNEIIVEIKALSRLTRNEEAQVINYLKATRLTIGLLINFGSKPL
jgi:tyrosine-protein phosphatase YwqE